MKKILFIKVCFCFLIQVFSTQIFAQQNNTNILRIQIEKNKVNAKTLSAVVLNIASKYKIPIGLELKKIKLETTRTKTPLLKKSGTLEEILNQLTKKLSGYSWNMNGGIVNIFPSKNPDNLIQEVLDIKIKELKLEFGNTRTDISRLILEIPEVENLLLSNGVVSIQINDISGLTYKSLEELEAESELNSTVYAFENTTVRGILNSLLSRGTINYWAITRWYDDEKSPLTIITK